MIPVFHSALDGMQQSATRFGVAANDVVTSQVEANRDTPRSVQVNLPNAFVDMKLAEHSYKASLAVLITAQEMSSVLLERDEKA